MTQSERRLFLIKELMGEERRYKNLTVPRDEGGQRDLLRSLMNVRPPREISREFLKIQDEYLTQATAEKGITDINDLTPMDGDLYIWQGDITTLRCGAIVNAANSGLTGCYYPLHKCIDNCIHSFAGVQLRLKCGEIMERQGHEEPTGRAKITPGYNLPAKYVLHTVGPIISGAVTAKDKRLLASCYRSCLKLAAENSVDSVAFCCISTGEFHFPNALAAEIAVSTVRDWKNETKSDIKVVFNVFKDEDRELYQRLLG
jgi:O-acetyl-ADP-ribose deacetylase (regulator of RNase III)